MFGFKKRSDAPTQPHGMPAGAQIPQQIYDTVQGSNARRRRMVVYSIIGVVLLALVVFASVKLYQYLSDKYAGKDKPASTSQNGSAADTPKSPASGGASQTTVKQGDANGTPAQTQQAPQGSNALPKPSGDPAATPASGSSNNSAISSPQ